MSPINEEYLPMMYSHRAELASCVKDIGSAYAKMGRSYNYMKKLFKKQPYRDVYTPHCQYPYPDSGSSDSSGDELDYHSDGPPSPPHHQGQQ
jgi:hypothetical protein